MFKWQGVFILLMLSSFWVNAQRTQPEAGDTIPVFDAQATNGQYQLDSVLPRPLVIVFWASWNEPSLQLLEELKQQYSFINPTKRGIIQEFIDVIDISIDTKPDAHRITLKREDWPWETHITDFKGWESDVVGLLHIQKVPTMLIIDERRKVLVVDPEMKQLRNVLSNIKMNVALSN